MKKLSITENTTGSSHLLVLLLLVVLVGIGGSYVAVRSLSHADSDYHPPVGTGTNGDAILAAAVPEKGLPYCQDGGTIHGPSHGVGNSSGITDCGHKSIVGFDCSGLVMYAVYQALSIKLPHYTGSPTYKDSQMYQLPRVGAKKISTHGPFKPGDILFFYRNYEHVVIYAGHGNGFDAHGGPGARQKVDYYPLTANGGGPVTAAFRF